MSMGPTGQVHQGGDPGAPTPTGTTAGTITAPGGAEADTVTRARAAASDVAHEAADGVRTVVQEASTVAGDVASKARQQLKEQAGEQTGRAAEGLHQFAGQLNQMAEGAGQGLAPDLAREASQRVQHLADRLQSGGLDAMAEDVKRFARTRPMVFLLGAAAAGMLVGRLVRAADTASLAQAVRQPDDEPANQLGEATSPALPPVDLRGRPSSPVATGAFDPTSGIGTSGGVPLGGRAR